MEAVFGAYVIGVFFELYFPCWYFYFVLHSNLHTCREIFHYRFAYIFKKSDVPGMRRVNRTRTYILYL